MTKDLVVSEERVIHMPIEAAWEVLSDSNHFNHYIDLFPVQFGEFETTGSSYYRHATAKALGLIPIKWHEHTFSWIRNEWFEIERIYQKSPIVRALWKVSLRPLDNQTTYLAIDGKFTYANLLGKVALQKVVIPQLFGIFIYADAAAIAFKNNAPRPQAKLKTDVDIELLTKRVKRLENDFQQVGLLTRLVDFLSTANDEDVTDMQPYRLAREWGIDRKEMLSLFLLATKHGLLQQKWSLLCPNCRVPKKQVTTLREVSEEVHCELCGVDYQVDFDQAIEMRFDVSPAIRKIDAQLFCINGPMNARHILGQFRIPAGESVELTLPDWEQPHRYRIMQHNHTIQLEEARAAVEQFTWSTDGFDQTRSRPLSKFTVQNTSESEIVFMIEELMWGKDALTARELTSLQLYRDLFATEVLAPDLEIQVSDMTVLFTDLKESTALYERIGDALAYTDVRHHFTYLKEHIQDHDGAIVKTIGDSVMAVFTDVRQAMRAATAIQRSIHELQQQLSQPVEIKIGFHQGPAIAVNANDLLDYFGRTVNLAARVQQLSQGSDIVMTAASYREIEGMSGWPVEAKVERFSTQFKGIELPIEVVRLVCKPSIEEIMTISQEITT